VSGEAFSAGCGRFARVFTGVAPGWLAPAGQPATAEDVEDHLSEIEDVNGFVVPGSVWDELRQIGAAHRNRSRP
jgi:hypothetical protein